MARNVVFVAPYLKPQTVRFLDAVKNLEDVRLFGICAKGGAGDASLRSRFTDMVEIEDIFSVDQVEGAARDIARRHGELHRLLSILELIQLTVAKARARLGLPGLTPEVAERFLDKTVMKDALRERGLPCARHALVRDAAAALAFVKEVGYPVILKPPVGAACLSTFFVADEKELREALAQAQPSQEKPAQLEEFITGDEYSFDTLTVGGKVRFYSINRYYPNPLEVMRNPWIQWCWVSPRTIDGPEFDDIREVGVAAAEKMGMENGITHMEWFRRPDGSIAIGEIAARPPGAQIIPGMGQAHGADFFRAWARAVVDGEYDGPWERKHAVGAAFLRGQGEGRVSSVDGIGEVHRRFGHLIVEEFIPVHGEEKNPSYEGEGYFLVRADDTELVRQTLMGIISTVRVNYL